MRILILLAFIMLGQGCATVSGVLIAESVGHDNEKRYQIKEEDVASYLNKNIELVLYMETADSIRGWVVDSQQNTVYVYVNDREKRAKVNLKNVERVYVIRRIDYGLWFPIGGMVIDITIIGLIATFFGSFSQFN